MFQDDKHCESLDVKMCGITSIPELSHIYQAVQRWSRKEGSGVSGKSDADSRTLVMNLMRKLRTCCTVGFLHLFIAV